MGESNQTSRLTWEGCSVLLDINDGERLVFARLSPAATLKIGKKNFSLQPIVGCPFGSSFRVDNGKDGPYLSRVVPSEEEGGNNVQEEENVTGEELRDNRALVDNNTAQSLTGEDIDEMRRQGATGEQIVEALIANSTTFENKTSFSQEKYRLRKQKKYAPKVLVRRPFVRSICDAYFRKYPARIGCLRSDSLALLLSMANVTAHSDVLVVDMVGGIVTGAVAERLGGTGYVCNMHLGVTPHSLEIVRIFNFNNDTCKRIVRCCLNDLCPGQNGSHVQNENMASDSGNQLDVTEEDVSLEENKTSVDTSNKTGKRDPTTCKAIKAGEVASEELIDSWKEKGFSSLIIAAPEQDVWGILQKLLPHLSYSASFAIYHQYLQVLPSRTHPHMQMSAFGGYILSGTKICTSESGAQ
uniref:tRNA (adenine(58)-N(1))-methyltransferase non-catalytic subunit TRM6 n=1 Tax=Chenopodium quinoa TaxID=63459 RepID=A0A803KVA5_CHEQI